MRNPFRTELNIFSIQDDIQNELMNLRNNILACQIFKVKDVTQLNIYVMDQSHIKISFSYIGVLDHIRSHSLFL